jgi:hypothetical protein
MGFEFHISFAYQDQPTLRAKLERLPGARLVKLSEGTIELRSPQNASSMPDATINLLPEGLYFCDHGGYGREILVVVVALLSNEHCPLTLEELE